MLSVGTDCGAEESWISSGGSFTLIGGSGGSEATGDNTEVLDCVEDGKAADELTDVGSDDGGADTEVIFVLCSGELVVLWEALSTGTSFLPPDDKDSAATVTAAHPARTIIVYFAAIPIFFIFMTESPRI